MPNKLVVIINASAGTAKGKSQDEWRESLRASFAAHGMHCDIRFPEGDELKREVDAAKRGGAEGIVVGGGDGTIRSAAAILTGSETALGVLPLGTLNHFAKDLGIPLGADEAIAVVAAGHSDRIDVASVNDEIFINNSSIGIYPFLVLDRERMQEQEGKHKWYAASLASVRALRKFPLRRLRIRVAGETVPHRSPLVFIGNNEYGLERKGLGMRERLDRGELSIHIAKAETRVSFVLLVLRGMLGKLKFSRDLQTLKAQTAEITSRTSRLPVALDGEVEILTPPLRYEIRKRALKVFVPKDAS